MTGSHSPQISPTQSPVTVNKPEADWQPTRDGYSLTKPAESRENVQDTPPIRDIVPGDRENGHYHIFPRSDSRNHTSKDTATASRLKSYTLHFLTNCRWLSKNVAENCTRPWDFKGITIGNDSPEDSNAPRVLPYLLKRDGVSANASAPKEDFAEKREKVIHNRQAFSKVHLTGCVLVGLSLLCTAISFFILPAFGQWISVGNLALATLSTIFLLTSSIFTAVLANKTKEFFEKDKLASLRYTAQAGGKVQALA